MERHQRNEPLQLGQHTVIDPHRLKVLEPAMANAMAHGSQSLATQPFPLLFGPLKKVSDRSFVTEAGSLAASSSRQPSPRPDHERQTAVP